MNFLFANISLHTPWKENYDQPRQHTKKKRHYFANKGPSSQGMVFPGVMYGCKSWTIKKAVGCQTPLLMGFFRQECWSGLLCPSPEDLPDPGIEPKSPSLQADSLPVSHRGSLRITIWSNNSTPEYMLQRIWSRHSNRYLYILFVPFIVALYTAKRWKQCNKSVIHIYI